MMCQYGVFSNCPNSCKFCLIQEKNILSKNAILKKLSDIKENLDWVDWKDQFNHGISLLGGELYYITDPQYKEAFLDLIDAIIKKVLKVSPNPKVKYSTVSNGMYDPNEVLFPVIDKIVNEVGINHVDFNVSYDLKYRFDSEEKRLQCLNTINSFHKRYDYTVGVQMILTQYVIDAINSGEFNVAKFEKEIAPGSILTFLYPHLPNPKLPKLPDFNFSRQSFLPFILNFYRTDPIHFTHFKDSVINSSKFKWTGMTEARKGNMQQPILTGRKEIVNPICGHSVLYQCYSDTDACMLCDLEDLL